MKILNQDSSRKVQSLHKVYLKQFEAKLKSWLEKLPRNSKNLLMEDMRFRLRKMKKKRKWLIRKRIKKKRKRETNPNYQSTLFLLVVGLLQRKNFDQHAICLLKVILICHHTTTHVKHFQNVNQWFWTNKYVALVGHFQAQAISKTDSAFILMPKSKSPFLRKTW